MPPTNVTTASLARLLLLLTTLSCCNSVHSITPEPIFMTPSDMIDEMSFSPKKRDHCPSYEPLAPPPSAPPPSPPPHAALQQPLPSSFSESRKAQVPRVTNYDSYHDSTVFTTAHGGDATVRPNVVGEANSANGNALPEFLMKLRMANLAGCTLSILLEIPVFMGHFLLLKWDQAVLGIYLMVFCLVLICYEIHTPAIATPLQDYFGLLYHPLGRGLYLLLLGGLCVGQSWIPLAVVGVLFWCLAGGTLYAYIKFPRYRRMFQDEHPNDLWMAARSRYTWARPEQEGLLHTVVQAAVTE